MNTMGDIDQIKPLSDFASKGVFTKELDIATMNNTIQIAVHWYALRSGAMHRGMESAAAESDACILPVC